MAKKEYSITYGVFQYASACINEGDWAALRDMGFGTKEINALHSLNLIELARLQTRIHGHVLRVELDRDRFWIALEQIRRESHAHEARAELIRLNAPADMMKYLFGMGAKEYAACRRALRAPRGVGRPNEPSDDAARNIWRALERFNFREDPRLPPQDWLQVAQEADVCLRVVWRLAQRWLETGTTPAERGERAS